MITLSLPRPISTNALFRNRRGGRARTEAYESWLWEAQTMLAMQKPFPRPPVPCRIMFQVGTDGVSARMDGDNCIKCLLDVLVACDVLEEDNRKIVRAVGMEWIDGKYGVTACISRADGDG